MRKVFREKILIGDTPPPKNKKYLLCEYETRFKIGLHLQFLGLSLWLSLMSAFRFQELGL